MIDVSERGRYCYSRCKFQEYSQSQNGKRNIDRHDEAPQSTPHCLIKSSSGALDALYHIGAIAAMNSSQSTSNPWPRRRPQLQKIVRPTREARESGPAIERKYDAESGQVYSEMEVYVNRRQNSDWIGEPRTPSLIRKAAASPLNGKGARSLADMAKRKTATQFRNLTAEHFSTVPWPVAEKVWKELLDRYGCRR